MVCKTVTSTCGALRGCGARNGGDRSLSGADMGQVPQNASVASRLAVPIFRRCDVRSKRAAPTRSAFCRMCPAVQATPFT